MQSTLFFIKIFSIAILGYINILEKTFICNIVRPYYKNKRTELVKSPKVYFTDTGFRNIVVGNMIDVENRRDIGQINENFVATELIKEGLQINFWRTKAGAEVDFIVEEEGKIYGIEIKTNLLKDTAGKAAYYFIEKYNPSGFYVFSLNYTGKKGNISFLPLAII